MKKNIFKKLISFAVIFSFILTMTINVNAEGTAILKTVKAEGDKVTQLFTEQTDDQSYMKAMITNVDAKANTLNVRIEMTNRGGHTNEDATNPKPKFTINFNDDQAVQKAENVENIDKYFDVEFTNTEDWDADAAESQDNRGGYGDANSFVSKSELTTDENGKVNVLEYTIKLKEGVNTDDLVGHTFQVLSTGLITDGTSRANYGYGANGDCAIPQFTFQKPETPVKTGVKTNTAILIIGVVGACVLVVALGKKNKMSRI